MKRFIEYFKNKIQNEKGGIGVEIEDFYKKLTTCLNDLTQVIEELQKENEELKGGWRSWREKGVFSLLKKC